MRFNLLILLLVSSLFLACKVNANSNNYDQIIARSGCCSWHGGVCGCSAGRAVCCDGTLSPSCGCLTGTNLKDKSLLASSFHGYPCTKDCSGHEAGYEWAESKGISDSDDCSGNSQSFIEGCEAYAEEGSDDESDSEE